MLPGGREAIIAPAPRQLDLQVSSCPFLAASTDTIHP